MATGTGTDTTVPTSMIDDERAIWHRLNDSVQQLRSTLRRLLCIDQLDLFDIDAAAALAGDANRSLLDALAATTALAHPWSASGEAIMLVATSKTALGVVRVLLNVLSAAFDSRAAA